ncbi:hypothetical protein [uncultured Staphylococcus sp.]|uniref:hypothetical protein n=1 Tax=uncultured Staphylococcus sp. TaxID=189668 RepID=UPI0025CDC7B6|nr:hypothetical protein [uncultured Staphylococcus sp.]
MYKLKEFVDRHLISIAYEEVNKFVEENNINDYEVVGYSTFGASNEHGIVQEHTSILIKYWENDDNE